MLFPSEDKLSVEMGCSKFNEIIGKREAGLLEMVKDFFREIRQVNSRVGLLANGSGERRRSALRRCLELLLMPGGSARRR